jgi:hypothetical protein
VRPGPVPLQHDSVSEDWRVPLKGDKSQAYLHCVQHLEIAYSMFSVNLDEAFGMRRHGRGTKAYHSGSLQKTYLFSCVAPALHAGARQTFRDHPEPRSARFAEFPTRPQSACCCPQ